tara:strand:- start:117 stop:833 length:717 start_codon:yes stop_codon:yes gene_type:complete
LAKKFKKHSGLLLIIVFLLLIFIYNHNLFRKFYNIIFTNYETRLIKKHGYCHDDSVGFLRMLKKKYKFNFNPLIINYEDSVPNSGWSIYDTYNKIDKNHKILLNYPEKYLLNFKPLDNIFYSKDNIMHSNGIENIVFNLKNTNIRIDSDIKIYRKTLNKKDIIYEGNFHKIINNNQKIPIQFITKKINSRYKATFIEISELNVDQLAKINSITLNLNHEFDLKDFTIIEKFNNCYYVK